MPQSPLGAIDLNLVFPLGNQVEMTMQIDGIYNYFELLVNDEIIRRLKTQNARYSQDDIQDIACLALNHLPSKYIRHMVDATYFIASDERATMDKLVVAEVKNAFEFLRKHPGDRDPT